MKRFVYIVGWTAFGLAAIWAQFRIAKWWTETEKDPDLAETVRFTEDQYPDIAARITPEALQAHITALSSIPSRLTGTSGCDQAAEYVKAQLRALGAGEPQVQEFPVTVPVYDRAEIRSAEGTYPLHPLLPNGVCPAATPEEGLETRLVYAGFGRLEDVNGKDLAGATVVIEALGRENWMYLIDLGAHAVIFVERERPSRMLGFYTQTFAHQDVPRFWMTRAEAEPLLARLKLGDLPATLHSDARWERRTGRNLWVDLPGVSTEEHNREEVVVLESYYDSSSFAPDLAPGAEQACGIATLLELAELLREFPLEKRVRILATSGHFQALEGARRYVWEHVGRHSYGLRDVSPQGHAAFLGIDLSSGADRVGLFYGGMYFSQMANNLKPRLSDLGRRATRYAAEIASALGRTPETTFIDTINPAAGKEWMTYLPAPMAFDHEAALLAGVTSLSFASTNDTRIFSATPGDTTVEIDNLAVQAKVLACLLPNAFNVQGRYVKRSMPRSICRISGRAVSFDPKVSYLPDKPIPGALVFPRRQSDFTPFYSGVFAYPVATADENGRFEVVGMATKDETTPDKSTVAFEPFVLDRGRITWAPDFGQLGMASYPLYVLAVQKEMELMCVAFPCRTLEINGLVDPRSSMLLNHVTVLEAGGNSAPSVYGSTLVVPTWPSFMSDCMTVYARPGERLKFTAGPSARRTRMLLLNVPEQSGGQLVRVGDGFDVNTTPRILTTYLQAARDMWRLDESRIAFFAGRGIRHDRVDQLHGLAAESLANAERALKEKRYTDYLEESRRALSLEIRAYPDVLGMANDVVRGLIFYLALLIPFAFTMERLFLAGRRIETRIAGIALFFLAMFFILRFTHPAFRIVLSPMVVLLGFVVAVLSTVVISIVMSRLETLVSKRRVEQEGEHESGVRAVSGLALAVEMGIANMRRRKARTVLTSLTLIALTFSVLSFASISSQLRTQEYVYKEGSPAYEGVLFRKSDWSFLPYGIYAALRNELQRDHILAPRRWYYGALVLNQSSIELRMGDRIGNALALLGLSPQEKEILAVERCLLGKSRWIAETAEGDPTKAEVLLPINLAAQFAGRPKEETGKDLSEVEKARYADAVVGRSVRLLGRDFEVVGVFDWEKMNKLLDIDGENITPFDPLQMEQKAQEEGALDPESVTRYIHHSFKDVPVVSEPVLGDLGGDLRCLAIKPRNPELLDPLVRRLVREMDFILFANLKGVPTLLSSRDATSVSDLWNLVIIMAIAGLIVFNTMLGSVFERTKEIGTYTALGIAPSHIGGLFLVEAAVFSIIGVMAGYVLGQTVSRLANAVHLPLLSALNLNYSSLAGVLACLIVMAMVLLSTLYPARKASRIGVPDIERRWKLPRTKEATITLELPFTVSPREAPGLLAFLKEYLDSHVDVMVGAFYAEHVELARNLDGSGDAGVRAQFWLTPLDLGVSQYTSFSLHPVQGLDIWTVRTTIERLSGDAGSWRRANGRFMGAMRSQFLLWRNLTPATRAEYVARGEALLGGEGVGSGEKAIRVPGSGFRVPESGLGV